MAISPQNNKDFKQRPTLQHEWPEVRGKGAEFGAENFIPLADAKAPLNQTFMKANEVSLIFYALK